MEEPTSRPSSGFERALDAVPALLAAIPDEAVPSVAAASWSALTAVLWGRDRAELCVTAHGALVAGIARRMQRGVAALGTVRLRHGSIDVGVPADDAGVLVGALRQLEETFGVGRKSAPPPDACGTALSQLEALMGVADSQGTPLRLRVAKDLLYKNRSTLDSLTCFLGRSCVSEHLRELDVADHSDDGRLLEAAARALPAAQGLRKLSLGFAQASERRLADSEVPRDCTEALAQAVSQLPALETLIVKGRLQAPPTTTAALCRAVASSGSIEALTVECCDLSGCATAAIEDMLRSTTTLRKLGIKNWQRGAPTDDMEVPDLQALLDALGAGLANNDSLEELVLPEDNYCSVSFDVFDSGLTGNSRLRSLDLRRSDLDENAAASFARAVQGSGVRRLGLHDSTSGPAMAAVAQVLAVECNIVELDLSHDGDSIFEWETSSEEEDFAVASAMVFGALGKTLQKLNLGSRGTQPESIAALARAVGLTNGPLRSLRMTACELDLEGATALGSMLGVNSTLRELWLNIWWESDDSGAGAIAAGLALNSSLEVLELSGEIRSAGVAAIAEALGPRSALRELNLSRQGFEPLDGPALVALAAAIDRGAPLKHLNVAWPGTVPAASCVTLLDAMMRGRRPGTCCVDFGRVDSSAEDAIDAWCRRQGLSTAHLQAGSERRVRFVSRGI
ncbi:unnamed protein product [Pedinophyceae sp. YPF-701]|nr:unnamed protein product [Pedinophyceae sp. YPF-701]